MLPFIMPVFQPVLDLDDGNKVAFFEAFLRIKGDKSERGHIDLLSVAERYGFIQHLDIAVLNQALVALDYIDTPIAVNVSSYTIQNHMAELLAALERRGANADRLIVDIGDVVDEKVWPAILQLAAKTRRRGIRFVLADENPLPSRVNYIRSLRPEFVKISQKMLQAALVNDDSEISTLVAAVHSCGGHLLAGHVEDVSNFEALRLLSIRYAQGYGIGTPARVSGATSLARVV